MVDLDEIIDAFEEAVSREGILAVAPASFAPPKGSEVSMESRSRILIEILRVWMELRWKAQKPVTVYECLQQFPSDQFTKIDLESLQYEEQRQRLLLKSRVAEATGRVRSTNELPTVGSVWGDFQLLQVLGEGAFAKVYLARQVDLADRLVALKLSFRETQEANWLARLQHSSIVPIYSVHQEGDIFGICMPYLGNSTLADLIRELPRSVLHASKSIWRRSSHRSSGTSLLSTLRQRHSHVDTVFTTSSPNQPYSPNIPSVAPAGSDGSDALATPPSYATQFVDSSDTIPIYSDPQSEDFHSPATRYLENCDYLDAVAWIGAQLADALAHSHRMGILHCDIKPANVLMARDGQPRLLDFNVSNRTVKDAAMSAPMGGTIPYMSPEHRRAIYGQDHVDGRSDIYSLGVVLFEMLTGSLPNPTAMLGPSHDEGSRMRFHPRELNPSVSPALSAIIAKCLQTDPSQRYRNAEQLCEDLEAHCQQMPLVHQREPSLRERATKWMRRHPRLASAGSMATVASVLLLAGLFAYVVRGRALKESNWQHRLSVLEQRLPVSIAMLTSIEHAPHLRQEVAHDLNYTLSLMMDEPSKSNKLDPRWITQDILVRDEGLRQELEQLIRVANRRPWRGAGDMELVPGTSQALLEDRVVAVQEYFGIPFEDSPSIASEPNTMVGIRNWIRQGKLEQARVALSKMQQGSQYSYTTWWLLGDCYSFLGDHELAQQAFTACIALRPEIAIAYFNRGNARLMAGEFELAEKDFQKTSALSPSWQWARFNRAQMLKELGRIDEAIRELSTAIDCGYRTVSVFRLRSELYGLANDLESQQADLKDAMACMPIDDQDWIDRGLIRIGNNPKGAAEDFERALTLAPNSIDAHQKLAYVYSELLQQPEKSLEHLNSLVRLAKNQMTHVAGRAVVHARGGQSELAMSDLERASAYSGRDSIVLYQIASAYAILAAKESQDVENPNADLALAWLAKALQIDPRLAAGMEGDSDLASLSKDPRFMELLEAAKTLVQMSGTSSL